MREIISYDRNKDEITKTTKMKPFSNIKGKVKVELINNETKEVEREILTENIRMKWLEHQIYLDGLCGATCLWDFAYKYAGQSTTYGKQLDRGGAFTNLLLYNSEEIEDEKKPSIDATLIGYCTLDATSTSATKGKFIVNESHIKNDSEGNIVMHNVYEFPSNSANGTTTHIGFSKQIDTYNKQNYSIFGDLWGLTSGLPSSLAPQYETYNQFGSKNCYIIEKNTFRFIAMSSNILYVCDVNITSGYTKMVPLKNVLGANFGKDTSGYTYYITGMQISKDGTQAIVIAHSSSSAPKIGATQSGWNILTFDCETGNCIDYYNLGELANGSKTENIYEYAETVLDIYGNGNLIIYGRGYNNAQNFLTEYNISDRTTPTKVKYYEVLTSDSDRITEIPYSSLNIYEDGTICLRRNSVTDVTKNHLFWNRNLELINRHKNVSFKPSYLMDIIGKPGFALGTTMNGEFNKYSTWGIFDTRKKYPMTTLTKLPSPVVKTSNFTMKVQYDIIFEVPDLFDAFIEKEV